VPVAANCSVAPLRIDVLVEGVKAIDCSTGATTATLIEGVSPCQVAVMATAATTTLPVTMPVFGSTAASAATAEDQATVWVRSAVVPSE